MDSCLLVLIFGFSSNFRTTTCKYFQPLLTSLSLCLVLRRNEFGIPQISYKFEIFLSFITPKMSNFIVIREYKTSDIPRINEVISKAYLSTVFPAWITFMSKEITFQLIVLGTAVMFIFLRMPVQYCLLSIPIVLLIILIFTYLGILMKAMELTQGKRFIQCWVAESLEPVFSMENPQKQMFRVIPEHKIADEGINLVNYRKRIVGTVSVSRFTHDESAAWLFRLAVEKPYRRKGIAQRLVQAAEKWCTENRFTTMMCGMSECQEGVRRLFMNNRYLLKHMYHRQILGSALTLLMYQLECTLLSTYSYRD